MLRMIRENIHNESTSDPWGLEGNAYFWQEQQGETNP